MALSLLFAASAWLVAPLGHAATLLPDEKPAAEIDAELFAPDVDDEPAPVETNGLARGGKNAHKKVPSSLHSTEWKHVGSGGHVNGRKAARYDKDPHKKRKAEIALTKQQNKMQRKGHRKNPDGTYKTQVRLGRDGQKHFFQKR
jgi:hypothetical protein